MSYTTFHKVNQDDNGDFLVKTKCSNDGAPPSEWVMDYYRKSFPGLNNEQKEAAFILQGLYSGNKYYPEKYKWLEKIASEYCHNVFVAEGYYPYDKIFAPMSLEQYKKEQKLFLDNPEKYKINPEDTNINRTYAEYIIDTNNDLLKAVNGFIEYKQKQVKESKISAKIKLNNGDYVKKLTMNSRKIEIINNSIEAKIFNRTKEEINQLINRIPKYLEPEIIIV